MIPDIGLMVGLYIITRMVVVICDAQVARTPKFMGVVTVIVTLICIVDLMSKGTPNPLAPHF